MWPKEKDLPEQNKKKRHRDSSTDTTDANKENESTHKSRPSSYLQCLREQEKNKERKAKKLEEKNKKDTFLRNIQNANRFLEQGKTDLARIDNAAVMFYQLLQEKPDSPEARSGFIMSIGSILDRKKIFVLSLYFSLVIKMNSNKSPSEISCGKKIDLVEANEILNKGLFNEAAELFYRLIDSKPEEPGIEQVYLGLVESIRGLYNNEKIKILFYFLLTDINGIISRNKNFIKLRLAAIGIKHFIKEYNDFMDDVTALYKSETTRSELVVFLQKEHDHFPKKIHKPIDDLLRKHASKNSIITQPLTVLEEQPSFPPLPEEESTSTQGQEYQDDVAGIDFLPRFYC